MHYFITPKRERKGFYCTFIYGSIDKKVKKEMWVHLVEFVRGLNDAWIVMGDFNAIMEIEDRVGGAPVKIGDIQAMRKRMTTYNLITQK